VGTLDLFHTEDQAYAQKMIEHQVPCEFVEVPGAFHGFDVIDPRLPVVQEFRKSQIAALKKTLFGNEVPLF
jgi:acetyl esterase/lipase